MKHPKYLTRKLGTIAGRPVFRWACTVQLGERAASPGATLDDMLNVPLERVDVIAHTSRDAAALLYGEHATKPCTTIRVYGPRGGLAAERFIGWETAVGNQLLGIRP